MRVLVYIHNFLIYIYKKREREIEKEIGRASDLQFSLVDSFPWTLPHFTSIPIHKSQLFSLSIDVHMYMLYFYL